MDRSLLPPSLETHVPATLRFLKDLVEINSYTGNPTGVKANAERIIRQFAPLGFLASRVPCAEPGTGDHLILDSGGTGPVIACISHLDTVFSPVEEARNHFHWKEEGTRIYGPGVYDIKGGTAMIWLLLATLKSTEPDLFQKARWILLWNAAEERLVPDFAGVCLKTLPANTRCCLVFEGDNRSEAGFTVTPARKGRGTFRIRVSGRGAHAGSRHREGANAIRQIARVVEQVEALTDESREVTVNVGIIRGGSEVNRVPHEAELLLEVRTYEEETYAAVRETLLALNGPGSVAAQSDGFACQIQVEVESEINPWPPNAGSDELAALWKQAAADCGWELENEKRGGISDGNGTWKHFPTLDGLGPRGGNHHSSERSPDDSKLPEFLDSSSLLPKAAINYQALKKLIEGF